MSLRHSIYWPITFALLIAATTHHACFAKPSPGGRTLPTARAALADPATVAKTLADADVWILPQPKSVVITAQCFDLKKCKGVRLVGCSDSRLSVDFPALLAERSGVRLKATKGKAEKGYVSLVLCPKGVVPKGVTIAPGDLEGLGEEGYYLRVDDEGITAAALAETGLYYAIRTIAQMATDRSVLPGIIIRDWPSMRYRGFQYDVSRGQMPKTETLKRLAGTLAEAKMNTYELYIENQFAWTRHPDIAPPEAISAKDARALFDAAARYHMEVHPLMQTFGHFYNIGSKPAYRKYMVPDGGTVDIRKPEAVAFVLDLIDEICDAFPGKFLNVDITEINDAAFKESGTTQQQLTELTLQYAIKMRDELAKRGMRLMVVQGPLAAEGSLTGLGSVVERLPKDIVVGSYYTAEFYGGWESDFSRLRKLGLEFLAQPWIDSHGHIMPYVGHAMDFSDLEISRGLQYGAAGSVTCDWGDDGHYDLPGMTWYPALYHGACAWTGAKLDRNYFNKAFGKLVFGINDDSVARAIVLAGNINGQKLKLRNAAGGVDEPAYVGNSTFGRYYYEFFGDPFTDPKILDIVEPGNMGRSILAPAQQAEALFEAAKPKATRNKDVLDQLLFAARNYEAMGKKLIIRERYLDESVPRAGVAEELLALASSYEGLRTQFSRLWLKDCKDAGSYRGYLQRYESTIGPCRGKAKELLAK
jgi:hypothetical protein